MKTLFISTYDKLITISLLTQGKLLTTKENVSERNHSSHLVPMIDEVLKGNQMNPNDLDEIIVVNGPGSFTGVRLGVSVAKTLAFTLNIPIKTITSIEAIGISDPNHSKKLVTIKDAKGCYLGIFENNRLKDEIKYLNQDDFASLVKQNDILMVDNNNLDIEAIYLYLKDYTTINPHQVKSIYIKKIEVQND